MSIIPSPRVPTGGSHRPAVPYPLPSTPVIEVGLWILFSSQQQIASGQGSPGRCCEVASLVMAGRVISHLVCNVPGSVRAPVHDNRGSGMAGGS